MLSVDAALSVTDEYKNKITPYPVENGLDITDHIRQEPDEFDLEGIVSDDKDNVIVIGQDSKTAYNLFCIMAGRDYVTNGSTYLQNEYPSPVMVDIISKYRVFTDMVIEMFQSNRNSETGDSLSFKAHFKKIRKANTSLSNINHTSARGGAGGADQAQGNTDTGKNQTSAVKNPLSEALNSATQAFGAWWNGDISTAQLVGG